MSGAAGLSVQSRFISFRGVCDNWNFNASNPVVYVGGNYSQNGNHGMFYVNYTSLTNANVNHGSRHLAEEAKILTCNAAYAALHIRQHR